MEPNTQITIKPAVCEHYYPMSETGSILSSINKETTLEQLEKTVNNLFPCHAFSENSHTFKFHMLKFAVLRGNTKLIRELVNKEGKELLKSPEASIFASALWCDLKSDSFAVARTLIELGADVNEKHIPGDRPIVELFYNNATTEVLYLFISKGVNPVSLINPPTHYMVKAHEMANKANNCVLFMLGHIYDKNSSLQFLERDVVSLLCNHVARNSLFVEIEICKPSTIISFFDLI